MRWMFLALLFAVGCDDGVNPNPIYNGYHCRYGAIIVDEGSGPTWACAPAPPEPEPEPDAGAG